VSSFPGISLAFIAAASAKKKQEKKGNFTKTETLRNHLWSFACQLTAAPTSA